MLNPIVEIWKRYSQSLGIRFGIKDHGQSGRIVGMKTRTQTAPGPCFPIRLNCDPQDDFMTVSPHILDIRHRQ